MTTSPNLGLTLTPSTEATKNFLNWRTEMAGDSVDSNMMILDTEVGTIKNNMPTTTSDLTNDSSFVADASYVHTDANYTTAEKTRLAGMATGANNYTHPSTHSADIIVDGMTNKAYTATEKTNLANLLSTKTTTITTTWTGSTAPYTQTITVNGITSNDKPVISPIYSTTNATAILEKTAWNLIGKIETGTNSITVTCFEKKPVTAINVQIKGV